MLPNTYLAYTQLFANTPLTTISIGTKLITFMIPLLGMKQNVSLVEERAKIRKKLDTLLASCSKKHTLTTDGIINLVYSVGTTWGDQAHMQFQNEIMHRLGKNMESDSAFPILELVFECWNYFPHQDMNDKCPFELIQEANQQVVTDTNL
jgi:hypothetical protein